MPFLTPDAPPDNRYIYRVLRIPAQNDWIALVSGALASLLFESNWEAFGDMTPEDTAQLMKRIFLDYQDLYMPRVGSLVYSIVEEPSPNWLPCNGSIYLQADYPELMEVIDPFYKFTPTQFFTPHLSGRVLVGPGTIYEGATFYANYAFGGEERHTLTELEMPAHTHQIFGSLGEVLVVAPGEAPVNLPNIIPMTVGFAGGSMSHENRMPFGVCPVYVVAR